MKIRPLKHPDEYRDALVVIRRAWQAAYEGIIAKETLAHLDFETDDDERVIERFETVTAAPDRLVLVAIEDGEVIATGSIMWGEATKPFVDETDVELRTIYVDPPRWGEGIGTNLLDSLLSDVPSDAERLVLETLTGNEVGTSFYRSRAFDPIGEHEFTVDEATYPTTVFGRSLDR